MSALRHKKFLSTKEVAQFLKVNEKMVYSLINDKGLPATKVTGKWLFPGRLVEEWLEAHIINIEPDTSKAAGEGIMLVAGSDDPLLEKTLSLFQKTEEGKVTVYYANLGSMGGLSSLRRKQCHIAVSHLLEDNKTGYNFKFAREELDRRPAIVNFSKREQGILLAKGNPKNIQQVSDLAQAGISIANRPIGTGTRMLLDYEIAKSAISTSQIKGYETEFSRHLDVGLEILSGRVDAAPAIRAVAGILDLDFLHLRWERFDLLIAKENFFEQKIQHFISFLLEKPFQQLANSFSGYDLSLSGKIIYPEEQL